MIKHKYFVSTWKHQNQHNNENANEYHCELMRNSSDCNLCILSPLLISIINVYITPLTIKKKPGRLFFGTQGNKKVLKVIFVIPRIFSLRKSMSVGHLCLDFGFLWRWHTEWLKTAVVKMFLPFTWPDYFLIYEIKLGEILHR